jgi:hypothetical protein
MEWLLWQVWFWCQLSFLLGAAVAWLIVWLRRPGPVVATAGAVSLPNSQPPGRPRAGVPQDTRESSVELRGDESAPSAEYTVKGNESSMLYHPADSPYFVRVKADVWFRTPADAEAAGFTPWNRLRPVHLGRV